MTIQDLFIRSNEELKKVIDQIDTAQWAIEMPAGMTNKPATLAQTVAYHAYDDAWVPAILDGKMATDVGNIYESILTADQDELLNVYATYHTRAIDAVRVFSDTDRIVYLSYGDFSAHDYLQHTSIFRTFRVYDIAKLIGADTEIANDLVQGMWDELGPVVDAYRQMGVFPPAIDAPAGADLQTRLLALVGREWT